MDADKNPLDVLAQEEEERRSLVDGLTDHFTRVRPDLGERLIDWVTSELLRPAPDDILVRAISSKYERSFDQAQIVEACARHDRLIAATDEATTIIGLKYDGLVLPPSGAKNLHLFAKEHLLDWVVVPAGGCSVVYDGVWDGDAIIALPRLIDGTGEDFARECDWDLEYSIKEALGLEYPSYDPETGETRLLD